MKNNLKLWQFGGFVFTSVLGTLLHFAYEWSGNLPLLAPFTAVNESIFEHIKLLYFPALIFIYSMQGCNNLCKKQKSRQGRSSSAF